MMMILPTVARRFTAALLWFYLLAGCLMLPGQLHAQERLIFEERWEWDEAGALSSGLSFWRKLTGFDPLFAQVIRRADHDQAKALKFAAGEVAAPLLTKDQFPAGKKLALEMVFVRESEHGSWIRLSLLSGLTQQSGYFIQLYPNQIELVCMTPQDGTTILGHHRFTSGELMPGERIKVTLQINAAAREVHVLLDGHPVLSVHDIQPPDLGSTVRIGLRAQPGVEASIESLQFLSDETSHPPDQL